MKVRYTETALDEIQEILSYIAKNNPTAALRVSAAISAIIDRIGQFPQTAVETDRVGVRVTPVLPYRYLIFFTTTEDEVVIRNVRHSARQWPDFRISEPEHEN